MGKYEITDSELENDARDYLKAQGVQIDDDTPITLTIPGATKTPRKCMSGSGLMTQGGKFAPGYDAKLKSALYAIKAGTPEKIPDELKENGPMYRPIAEWTPELADEALAQFGWPQPVPPKPKAEKKATDAESNGDGEEKPTTSTKRGRAKAAAAAAKEPQV